MGAREVSQQLAAAGAKEAGESTGDLFFFLGLHPSPRVDEFVPGEVEAGFGIEFVHVIELRHQATTSSSSSSLSCATSSLRTAR